MPPGAVLGLLLAALVLGRAPRAQDADSAPLLVPPVEAWSFGPLQVEGAPIVANGGVLVPAREVSGRRIVAWFTLDEGRLVSRSVFPGNEPLALARSGERLAVRSGGGRVDVVRLAGGRLTVERTFVDAVPSSAPVLEDELLFARFGPSLVAWSVTRREPLWRLEGHEIRGDPMAHPRGLLALGHDSAGRPQVLCLDRATGAVQTQIELGAPSADLPALDATCEWAVRDAQVFVRPPVAPRSTGGRAFPWAAVTLDEQGFKGPVSLFDLAAAPLGVPDLDGTWVAPEVLRASEPPAVRWLLASEGGARTLELSSDTHHLWLQHVRAPAARAGTVLYLGANAVSLPDLEVLWRRPTDDLRFAPVPVDDGLLLVDGDHLRFLRAPPQPASLDERRAHELVADLDRRHGERLVQVAVKFARAGDGAAAMAFLDEAEALGVQARTVERARTEIERQGDLRAPDPRRIQAASAELAAIQERVPRELAEAVRHAAEPGTAHALLEALGRRCPEAPALVELLNARLPSAARLESASRSSWIEFLARRDALGLELLDPTPGDERLVPGCARVLAERASWRPDVVGYRSTSLLVVAPQDDPGAVARVLEAGELVLDVLGQVLGSRPDGARDAPLEIVLYPTRDEYLAQCPGDLGGLEAVLSWTAGHFDAGADVSRLFLPEGDARRARLLAVAAHELTHHWLARRSPFGSPRATRETPGYWIAEAIASWAEELALDPARGTWRADDPRAASLDTVASTPADELLDWGRVLALGAAEAQGLETGATSRTTLTWQLGQFADRSPLQLFYAQGAALAHFLYRGEGGRHRELLIRAVEGYQEGRPVDVARALGRTPAELGERVQQFARQTVGLPPH
jgi:hypothetical protein